VRPQCARAGHDVRRPASGAAVLHAVRPRPTPPSGRDDSRRPGTTGPLPVRPVHTILSELETVVVDGDHTDVEDP
jgi:hypothetical protein